MTGRGVTPVVALLFGLALALVPVGVQAIYCDEHNCYDLLGITQDATLQEVKQAYRRLSVKYHPDKNPDPEANQFFLKLVNAYEILRDEDRRNDYDYALEHPEYYLWNTARYYQGYYGHQADPLSVVVGLLVILSGFQYLIQWTRHRQMVNLVKQTPAYKNKLKALELERNGGSNNRKKASKPKSSKLDSQELSKELDLQIQGADKPCVWELVGIRAALLPFTLSKLILWRLCWIWRYWVRRQPYTWEDAALLTRRSLRINTAIWAGMGGAARDNLTIRRLWHKRNMSKYVEDSRKEARRRR